MDYELETRIERAPEAVFDFFADLRRMPEWAPGLLEQRVDGDGPVGAGTTGTEVRRVGRRTATSRWTITEFERPRGFTMAFAAGTVSGEGRFRFEPAGDGATRVRVAGEARGGLLLRLGAPLFRRVFVREDRLILDAAKESLEAG